MWSNGKKIFQGSSDLLEHAPDGVYAPAGMALEDFRVARYKGNLYTFRTPRPPVGAVNLSPVGTLYANYAETDEWVLVDSNGDVGVFVSNPSLLGLGAKGTPPKKEPPKPEPVDPNIESYNYLKKFGGLYREVKDSVTWYYSTTYRVLRLDFSKYLELRDKDLTTVVPFTEVKPGEPIGKVERVPHVIATPLYSYQGNKALYIELKTATGTK